MFACVLQKTAPVRSNLLHSALISICDSVQPILLGLFLLPTEKKEGVFASRAVVIVLSAITITTCGLLRFVLCACNSKK